MDRTIDGDSPAARAREAMVDARQPTCRARRNGVLIQAAKGAEPVSGSQYLLLISKFPINEHPTEGCSRKVDSIVRRSRHRGRRPVRTVEIRAERGNRLCR